MSKNEIGLDQALNALSDVAAKDREDQRLSETTLRLVLQIAWEHQFDSESRTQARRQIAEVLSSEVIAAERRGKE